MSARNYLQWELVGEGSDPVVASEYDVDQSAKIFADQGQQMNDAASLLKQIADLTGWTGEAATQLADKADDAYSDLDKAAQKYIDAGAALSTFAGKVGTARAETAAAVADAVEAEAQRKSNATSELEGVAEPTDAQKDADELRGDRLDAANSALSAARTRLVNALEDLESAASTCASAIKNASEQFKDSTMDDVKGAVSSALAVIVDALNVLAIILAVVIVVLLIIGTGGAFLAFLITAAFWVGIAILAGTTIQFLMGDADGWDLLFAAFGAFGGKLLTAGGKLAANSIKSARVLQVARITQSTKDGMNGLVKFGQRFPLKSVRAFANGFETRAITKAVSAFNTQIDDLASTSRLLRGLDLAEMSTSIRQINALRGMNPTPAMMAHLDEAVGGLKLAGTGAAMQFSSQFKDGLGAPESFTNTFNNMRDGLDMLQDNPPVGPISAPINIHVSGVGR
ncbi:MULTISPECIES: putative T7SS-secreted protein [Aeromicrobium]|uniref:putative T7SS-secreted protein n=1 Tax=Aeromicrobium TaxID=2040 RepID=UPI0007013FDB|nr:MULTISPECIES: hypothetical protein [Aeromicrobium]KQX75019.1 hypothetical protein ASD10_07375 [Aeromicrobium sp. Root472D3]MCL8250910.1 hypothetical protein [Aeromicrobium fastidiosum]